MLKVVYIVTTVDGYGADKSILNNIVYLNKHKLVDPFVVIPRSGWIERKLIENNITYNICDVRSWFTGRKWFINNKVKRGIKSTCNQIKAYILSRKLIKYGQFDVVHTNTMTTSFGIHLSKYINAKHIMHIRELPIEQLGWCYEYDEGRTLHFIGKNSCAVIANSEYVARKFRTYLSDICVLYNGIFERNLMENPNRYDFKSGLRMISAGRLEEDKGQMVAIKAVEILKQRGYSDSDICLDIYGDGGLEGEYTERIKNKGLESLVKTIPFDSSLNKKIKDYHVGLICSRCEAFGRATIEFMGNGLAVVGNDTGNTPLLIGDGENGLIAKFGCPDELAQKICTLIADKALIKAYGQRAFESVRCGFSIEDSSRQLLSIYKSII